VTGTIRDDFYQDIQSVDQPSWTSMNVTPSSATNGNTILKSGATPGSVRYKMNKITLNGSSDKLTIQGDPTKITYVDIWVTGDVSVTGNGQIYSDPNVVVNMYVAGDVDLEGLGVANGSANTDSRPGNFLLFGIKPTDGSTKDVTMGGNGNMEASLYAPDSAVEIKGGGNSGSFSGSVVGKSVFMNGVTTVHYDEALARSGLVNDYRIISWVEDTR
jgi:hypothetical protein